MSRLWAFDTSTRPFDITVQAFDIPIRAFDTDTRAFLTIVWAFPTHIRAFLTPVQAFGVWMTEISEVIYGNVFTNSTVEIYPPARLSRRAVADSWLREILDEYFVAESGVMPP